MTRNVFFYIFFGPIVFGCVVSLLFSITFHKYVPSDLNVTKWSEFSHIVEDEFRIRNKCYAVLILMVVHSLQMYCCLPMLHITKILYGYWLGLLAGFSLCVAWEFVLYLFYLQYVRKNTQSKVQEHVSEKRKRGHLTIEIAVICLSTLPLQTKVLVYSLSDISKKEFMIGCIIPTSIMTLKNVIVGKMLTLHPSTYTLAIMASVITFSLVLPTLSTILFSSNVFLLLKDMDVYRDQKEEAEDPLIKVIPTPATSMSVILECDDEAECEHEETTKNSISNETADDEESSNLIVTNHTVDNV